MAVNYAEKYSGVIDEKFQTESYTDIALNDNYEFDGVATINIYSTSTVPLNDYDMEANQNRYGTPLELGNEVQTLKLTQDKSFTFAIDRRNYDDTMMANSAGLALNREIVEVIIPTIDRYWLNTMSENAGLKLQQTITEKNAYSCFLDASTAMLDKLVPVSRRVAFVTPTFYKFIKLDKNFTSTGDKAQEIARNGVVGAIDGTMIIPVPTAYFPEGVNFLIAHPSATISPIKLSDYKQHENPQGINGWLVEGRVYYDCFVLNNKKNGLLVSSANAG